MNIVDGFDASGILCVDLKRTQNDRWPHLAAVFTSSIASERVVWAWFRSDIAPRIRSEIVAAVDMSVDRPLVLTVERALHSAYFARRHT